MTDAALSSPPAKASPFHELEVLWVRHWTDQLFSFAIARPDDFRFRSGEFVMIGLPGEPKPDGSAGKPILRAYSIGSPGFADFQSAKSRGSRLRASPTESPAACISSTF